MRFWMLRPTEKRILWQASFLLAMLLSYLAYPHTANLAFVTSVVIVGLPFFLGDVPFIRWKVSSMRDERTRIVIDGYRVRYTSIGLWKGRWPREHDECMRGKNLFRLLVKHLKNKYSEMIVKSCNRCAFTIRNGSSHKETWDSINVLEMDIKDADGIPRPIKKFNLWRFQRGQVTLVRFLDQIYKILTAKGSPEAMKAIAR